MTCLGSGISHWFVTVDAWYQLWVSGCGVFSGQSYIGNKFFSNYIHFLSSFHQCSIFIPLTQMLFNPSNAELNPICYLLALLAHHFLHVSRIRFKSLTLRLLMSYIYMKRLFLMFLDHTQRRTTVGRTPLDE